MYHSTLGSRVRKKDLAFCAEALALPAHLGEHLVADVRRVDRHLYRDVGYRCGLVFKVTDADSYVRRIDSCITELEAQGSSRTCHVSKEEEEKVQGYLAHKKTRPPLGLPQDHGHKSTVGS